MVFFRGYRAGLFAALALFPGVVLRSQTIDIRPAKTVQFPGPTDSNSPGHWKDGFVLFNSEGVPYRSQGMDQFGLGLANGVVLGNRHPSPIWIEATWLDDDGTLFAWYHHEPGGICRNSSLTAPKIGAMVSYDNGVSFTDLGFVLQSGAAVDCSSLNGFFAGGNGDFSVVLDSTRSYFYFMFSNYGGDVESQGVAVARMDFNSRWYPSGSVWKYYNGDFTEPGLGGRVTPILPANVSWSSSNTDAFWGPSVHWNTALNQYVMLLNHSCCSPGWPQEGIYLSVNPDIGDPTGWSMPLRILDGDGGWYPQVLGEEPGETDKVAGAASRLYVYGISNWELVVTDSPVPDPDSDTGTDLLDFRDRRRP